MQKTTHYQLNKPEVTDPMRLADFNDNADKIDAALNMLNTAMAACGNCRVVTGTYTGTGHYSSENKNSLTFDKEPLALFITGYNYTAILIRGGYGYILSSSLDIRMLHTTWGTTVKWYSNNSSTYQMNYTTEYSYFALFA